MEIIHIYISSVISGLLCTIVTLITTGIINKNYRKSDDEKYKQYRKEDEEKRIYNKKFDILKTLLTFRYKIDRRNIEFQKAFLSIDLLFNNDKEIIDLFNIVYLELYPQNFNEGIDYISNYEKLLELIIDRLGFKDIEFKQKNLKKIENDNPPPVRTL